MQHEFDILNAEHYWSNIGMTKCVVSGDDLGDKPYVFTHNPDKYMAKINATSKQFRIAGNEVRRL